MKIAMWAAAGLLLAAGSAGAQAAGPSGVEAESGTIFTSILRIIVRWIFPVCAAYCFLHGVIGKGVKRGEWDMSFALTKEVTVVMLEIDYWEDLRTVEVPFEVRASVGLSARG